MRKHHDLTGQTFGLLTAIQRTGGFWYCSCSCGNYATVESSNLKGLHTQSCGCLQRARASAAAKTHGLSKTRTYHCWRGMRARCRSKNNPAYKWYGARGIDFDDSWLSFEAFLADMGECPADMSLERVDNSLGYSKQNCVWATQQQQTNNMRSNVILEFNGERKTVSQWARTCGMPPARISRRLKRGWSIEDTLTKPRQL